MGPVPSLVRHRSSQEIVFMRAWLLRLTSATQSPPTKRPAASRASRAAPIAPVQWDTAVLTDGQTRVDLTFFCWLVQRPADEHAPLGARERQALQQLARLASDSGAHAGLMPRAAAVVPHLLARLRAEAVSLSDLSQHVSRDVTLVAEVIAMANSAYYRREVPIVDLEYAIRVLGVEGLRSAIARVVLKPLIQARGGELVGCSAKRLWEHTDKKAQLCAAMARSKGLDSFDAYLLALIHNAAWNAVLRAMDGVAGDQPWHFSAALVAALRPCRDRLFALITRQWQLPGTLACVADEVARRGLAAGASMPVLHLHAADRLASLLCCYDQSSAGAMAEGVLAVAGDSVRECHQALVQPPGWAA